MKTIGELADKVDGARLIGSALAEVKSIAHDSRKAGEGTLFVAIPGAHVDGHKFIPDVIQKGATAILTTRDLAPVEGVTILQVPNLEEALREIVPFFHDYPARSMRVIGITGTNGKTTTTYLIRQILREAGFRVGVIGTIQILMEDTSLPIHNTTPDVVELQNLFALMKERGMDYVVMEVSSHALDQGRVAGVEFDVAVFTNLTQDHLDYHKTMEAYRQAKEKLFASLDAEGTKAGKTAIVNFDDAAGAAMTAASSVRNLSYGMEGARDLRAREIAVEADGAHFSLQTPVGNLALHLRITGIFNVYNVMGAVGAAIAEGVSKEVIVRALERFESVPGRFELVRAGQDFSVIVDYAHTPDGMVNVLSTARKIAKRRIISVFGCGGDRDRTKRPMMGGIAAELADLVIATSDNPRTEDPNAILEEVAVGIREKIGKKPYEIVADRRAAIFRAVELAEKDDIVLITGKGHEDYQILKEQTIHFDDKEVAREAIAWKLLPCFSLAEIVEITDARQISGGNLTVRGIATDTRKITKDALFVALKGENFNGEDFATEAMSRGASAVLVSSSCKEERIAAAKECGAVLVVSDTLAAYQEIARAYRRRFSVPVIAITGSNGKTTTKEFTAAVLSSGGAVHKTYANYNNEVGLPLTLLGMRAGDFATVVEMGMRGLGQIDALAKIAEPTIGVILNVGETHHELLGSVENIAKAKGELAAAVAEGGTLILNADDARVLAMRERAKQNVRILTFGFSKGADCRAEAMRGMDGETRFMVSYANERHEYRLPAVGKHNVYNGLAAIAAGFACGLSAPEIHFALARAERAKMRFEVKKCGAWNLVNDAYNASPMSMKAAIATMREVYPKRKAAVLGDMLELGEIAVEAHREIGAYVADSGVSLLITRGALGKEIAEGARARGMTAVYEADSHAAAACFLRAHLKDGDAVLFKGSRGMKMDEIIDCLQDC